MPPRNPVSINDATGGGGGYGLGLYKPTPRTIPNSNPQNVRVSKADFNRPPSYDPIGNPSNQGVNNVTPWQGNGTLRPANISSPQNSYIPSPTNTSNPFTSPQRTFNQSSSFGNPTTSPVQDSLPSSPSNQSFNSSLTIDTLEDYGDRLNSLLDNFYAQQLSAPGTPIDNMQPGIEYRVFWTATNWFGQDVSISFAGGSLFFNTIGSFQIIKKPGYGYPGGSGIFVNYLQNGNIVEERVIIGSTGGLYEIGYYVPWGDAIVPGTFQILRQVGCTKSDTMFRGVMPLSPVRFKYSELYRFQIIRKYKEHH
jgi:hypothetical protein